MKKSLIILLIGAGLYLSTPANATEPVILGGSALGCRSIVEYENILEANRTNEKLAGQMIDQAIAKKDCKLFQEGEKVRIVAKPNGSEFIRVQSLGIASGYFVRKGRVGNK